LRASDPDPGALISVVLGAGRGRRLGALAQALPKPLLPVLDRPLVAWQLAALRQAGLREVVVVIGHLGQRIVAELGDGRALGLRLHYAEQREPLGIAHALLAAEPWLDQPFVCLLGDVFFEPHDLQRLVQAFDARVQDGLLCLRREPDPSELARNFAVELDGHGFVQRVQEKPPPSAGRLRGAGLYLFTPGILAAARTTPASALRGERELTDAIQLWIEGGARLGGLALQGCDLNLSGPRDLWRANLRALELEGRSSFVAGDASVPAGCALEHSVVLAGARLRAPARLLRCLVLPGEDVPAGDYADAVFAGGERLSCAEGRR
jgi:glucose-1-phosphate thymidylyltransferase